MAKHLKLERLDICLAVSDIDTVSILMIILTIPLNLHKKTQRSTSIFIKMVVKLLELNNLSLSWKRIHSHFYYDFKQKKWLAFKCPVFPQNWTSKEKKMVAFFGRVCGTGRAVLGIEPRALYILGKYPATQLHPQPSS